MKSKGRTRFDLNVVRELAGGKTFARGEKYYSDGSVEILSLSPKRVVAQVAGTEDYRTILVGRGTEIAGECSCPAYADQGFCKHMVAAALAANGSLDGAEAESVGSVARIRDHLKSKGVDGLVDMVLELAEENHELFRKLDMDSALAGADERTLEARLWKAIDAATRTGTYVDYRKALRWRGGVETVLNSLAGLASGPRARLALKMIEHAIDRIEAASEAIDDSDGHLGTLLGFARDIHLTAAGAASPDPVLLARELFKRQTENDFGTFADAIGDYADVLGERGLSEYQRLAIMAWDKLPAKSRRTTAAAKNLGARDQLKAILDFFAERSGDVEARIALRSKDLSSPWDHLQLAEFCLSQEREEEALRRAEEGLWLFEDDRQDDRLLLFVVKLLTKADRKVDAEAHLWRAFQKSPSLGLYKELHKIGGESAAERALAFLETRLAGSKGADWHNRPGLLVEILTYEKKFDAAWSVVRKYGISVYAMEALVEATDVHYPREALDFYAVQVEQLASGGMYREAVARIGRMAKLQSPAEQAAYSATLKIRHARKRNFMKLLK
jgi:hypothetical protein